MQQFTEKMPPDLQRIHKCAKAVLPRAVTGVFSTNLAGKLEFVGNVQDDERPFRESGHVRSTFGDSGSPFWIPVELHLRTLSFPAEYRATMIAIDSARIGEKSEFPQYSDDIKDACNSIVIKLTNDIIEWTKRKSGIVK